MPRLTGRVLRGTAIAVALVGAFVAGIEVGGSTTSPQRVRPTALDDAADKISKEAAGQVDRGDLEQAAISGMLRRLGDRWARFYTAQEYDDVAGRLNGQYSGVGLWLGATASAIEVASVQPGSPADKAGVQAGDVVTEVAGQSIAGANVSQVAALLRGRPATTVEITIRRGADMRRFQLVRSAVESRNVTAAQLPDGVRLVRVAAFTRGVGREVRAAAAAGDHSGGIVLDLRANPGGLLDEAVEVASVFLADGPVVTYDRRGETPRQLDAVGPADTRTPLVVLVDAGTASAGEVVAAALQDRDRAVVVGSRTFGKGSVQEPVRLNDGSTIELTVGRYRTPSGRSLDGVGIDPDVAVQSDRPPRVAERRALSVLRGLLATLPTKDRG